ncbi:MAG: hydrogenase formation protein HypD [Synechococcaceae cyanobacterium]
MLASTGSNGSAAVAPLAAPLVAELEALCRGRWTVMEVCGGPTHAIVRSGLDRLLPAGLSLIHGPGCPVCVTPVAVLDQALALARRPEVILCSYGDMLRVPGSAAAFAGRAAAATAAATAGAAAAAGGGTSADPLGLGPDLLAARACGADVRLLTSPLQALQLARRHPGRQVVFLAVGFETTAPATALLARQALELGLTNLSLLTAHVRVVPAMEAILAAPDNRIQGFLAAGHVCSITGTEELAALVRRWRVPVVVTGFTPTELLLGLRELVGQLEAGGADLANAYPAVVRSQGNPAARRLLAEVFEPVTLTWRGLGPIEAGGLALRGAYAQLEASRRFQLPIAIGHVGPAEPETADGSCIAAAVLQGRLRPPDCPSFGRRCSPEHPLGAPMVSSEGACAAYWQYRR